MTTVAEIEKQTVTVPVIMDAGSQSRVAIRRLKRGSGRLMREVNEILAVVRSSPTTPATGLVPVVIIYRKRDRRRRRTMGIPTPLDLFR